MVSVLKCHSHITDSDHVLAERCFTFLYFFRAAVKAQLYITRVICMKVFLQIVGAGMGNHLPR